jgi:hypothetical protein
VTTSEDTGFLGQAPESAAAERLFAHDRQTFGFVMNLSSAWAHQPDLHDALFDLIGRTAEAAGLSYRERGVLISALASTMGDPHCSLAWGSRLAGAAGDDVAAGVLRGADDGLEPAERALAAWAGNSPGTPTAPRPPTSRRCARSATRTSRSPPSRCSWPSGSPSRR